jgi:hypothetical protein
MNSQKRPTPEPGEIYQHYSGKLAIIYAIARWSFDEPYEPFLTAKSTHDSDPPLLITIRQTLYYHNSLDFGDLVIYGCSNEIWYRPMNKFLEVLSNPNNQNSPNITTYFYRFTRLISQNDLPQMLEIIKQRNLLIKPLPQENQVG